MVRQAHHATPEAISHILADEPGYPSRNTTVTRVDGRIVIGVKVTLVSLIAKSTLDLGPAFDEFAVRLKTRAERS
jgi:hypothetical protein